MGREVLLGSSSKYASQTLWSYRKVFIRVSLKSDPDAVQFTKSNNNNLGAFVCSKGFNGTACVLKTLCEVGKKRSDSEPGSFLAEIVRAIFRWSKWAFESIPFGHADTFTQFLVCQRHRRIEWLAEDMLHTTKPIKTPTIACNRSSIVRTVFGMLDIPWLRPNKYFDSMELLLKIKNRISTRFRSIGICSYLFKKSNLNISTNIPKNIWMNGRFQNKWFSILFLSINQRAYIEHMYVFLFVSAQQCGEFVSHRHSFDPLTSPLCGFSMLIKLFERCSQVVLISSVKTIDVVSFECQEAVAESISTRIT